MSDSVNVVLRFALYTDLMLLFGLAVFGLYSLRGRERISGAVLNFESLLVATAAMGMVLSVVGMIVLAQNMSGAADWAELQPHIGMMLTETEVGFIWIIRMFALALALLAATQNKRWPSSSLWIAATGAGLALASLAWNGHGAMDEGTRRFWHFAADILHLLAAGGWIGALAAFGLLLRLKKLEAKHLIEVLSRALTGFESVGALIVGVIVATGVVNYLFIVGPSLDGVTDSTYGILLFAKLALFGGMVVLAALNRFHLSPLLEQSLQAGDYTTAVNALRRSMVLEFSASVAILLLVAWLGTLSPAMDMAA